MEYREFEIDVYKDADWEIRLKGLDDYNDIPPSDYDKYTAGEDFGIFRLLKDKIIYIFDSSFFDDNIEKCKKDRLFSEICIFRDINKNYTFKGSFIDALEYIKIEFSENKKKEWEY